MKDSEISICFLIRGGYLVLAYKYENREENSRMLQTKAKQYSEAGN